MSLKITVWDVQHGSAAFIQTPKGTNIVKDLGIGSFGADNREFSPLRYLKKKQGIDRLDYVIISHPHKDHIDDILNFDQLDPRALSRPKHLSPDDVIKSVREEDKPLFEKYFEINDKYSAPVSDLENPRLPANNGGVEILNFSPTKCSTSNINNHSIVTIFSYASSKVLIPGDNEPPSWRELLEDSAFKDAIKGTDVFVASHHGNESGYCADLFEHFKPRLTVISADYETEASATDTYTKLSRGWKVHHRDGREMETRYSVTTRSDGDIVIHMGIDDSDKKPFLSVTIS